MSLDGQVYKRHRDWGTNWRGILPSVLAIEEAKLRGPEHVGGRVHCSGFNDVWGSFAHPRDVGAPVRSFYPNEI